MTPPRALTSLLFLATCSCGAGTPSSTDLPRATPVLSAPPPPPEPSSRTETPSTEVKKPANSAEVPLNVILLVVDAMRFDMPWDGYPRDIAPNLTKLRAQSVRYERAYSISSFTSKSVGGLLSGRFPSELARTAPFFTRYEDSNEMMAEVLQRAGVRTISAHAHKYLDKPSGLTQGFDDWRLVDGIDFDYNKDPYITAPKYTELLVNMLGDSKNTSGQFFAYFHYMDPHDIYNSHPEAPAWGSKPRDLYDQEIFFTDLWIKKLLDFIDAQPWGKHTAIVVTGDHGEGFGERVGGVEKYRIWKHAFELYEVLVRVPLFVRLPGDTGRDIPRWRSHIDLAPTIYELLGVTAPSGLFGTSLLAELKGQVQPARPIIVDLPADTHNRRRRALIDDGHKLISFGKDYRFSLFDITSDPWESKDLHKSHKDKKTQLVARYKEIVGKIHDVDAKGGGSVKDD